jgi:hypothetical protein
MGWLLPTVYLKWYEPKEVTQAREEIAEQATQWWVKPIMVLVLGALMMFDWWLGQFNPNNVKRFDFGTAVAFSLGATVFLIYALPRMLGSLFARIKGSKAQVKVTEKMIIYVGLVRPVQFPFKKIERCRIVARCNDGSPALLSLEFHNGKSRILGVAPEVSLKQLEQVLRDRCCLPVTLERN